MSSAVQLSATDIFRAFVTVTTLLGNSRISKLNIYVGNMPFSMDEDQLRTIFGEFGDITSANVIMDRDTGRPRGFAFIEMQDDDARKAIAELNEKEFGGRKLNINEARPRQSGGGGGGRRY